MVLTNGTELEAKISKKLEFRLVSTDSYNILKKPPTDSEKVGRIVVGIYSVEGVNGNIFIKGVYDNGGKRLLEYISPSKTHFGPEEKLEIMNALGIPENGFIAFRR